MSMTKSQASVITTHSELLPLSCQSLGLGANRGIPTDKWVLGETCL